jgi:hypothetical protein
MNNLRGGWEGIDGEEERAVPLQDDRDPDGAGEPEEDIPGGRPMSRINPGCPHIDPGPVDPEDRGEILGMAPGCRGDPAIPEEPEQLI